MSRRAGALLVLLALGGLGIFAPAAPSAVRAQETLPVTPPVTAPSSGPPVLSEPLDFDIEETSGVTRNLRALRGRIVVVFHEDREHTDTNRALKMELHQFIQDNALGSEITTYGIANLHGVEGVIRDLARTAIRAMAAQYGIQILLDWEGVLLAAPFSCADHEANFLLIDRQGRIRYRHAGVIEGTERTAMYRVLRALIHEPRP
jgi:cytochrome oxidase Cu insertion factor (SCO1/SenC/PrrC family)